MNHSARTGSPGLQAGATVENDHDVLAEIARLLFLAFTEPLAGSDHQYDRNDAPRNPEHGQESTQLMRPQSTENVANEIAQDHGSMPKIGRSSRRKVSRAASAD